MAFGGTSKERVCGTDAAPLFRVAASMIVSPAAVAVASIKEVFKCLFNVSTRVTYATDRVIV